MATAAKNAEYAADRADFIAEMNENGRRVGFGVRSGVGDDWNPSGDYVEQGTAGIFPSDWKRDFSNDVQSDDLFFFVGAELDIENTKVMKDGTTEYTIKHVEPFKPDQMVIFYEIQVRV